MSERPYAEAVGALREIRPSEDLSLLHTYDLRGVFDAQTIAALGLVETRDVREPDSFRPISAPMAAESPEAVRASDEPIQPHREILTRPSEAVETRDAGKAPATAATEVPRRDWLLDPEPITTPQDVQPYGDDPVRMRELVQWFADGRIGAMGVLVPRAAGDLVEIPAETHERPHWLRAVASVGRTG